MGLCLSIFSGNSTCNLLFPTSQGYRTDCSRHVTAETWFIETDAITDQRNHSVGKRKHNTTAAVANRKRTRSESGKKNAVIFSSAQFEQIALAANGGITSCGYCACIFLRRRPISTSWYGFPAAPHPDRVGALTNLSHHFAIIAYQRFHNGVFERGSLITSSLIDNSRRERST